MLAQTKTEEFTSFLSLGFTSPQPQKKQLSTWNCKLSEVIIGEYLIIPLTSARMLKSEAYWMNNCCGEFIKSCASKKYCIFSIRSRSGERQATLGLVYQQDHWVFDQCFGPSNTVVTEETREYLDEDGELQLEWYGTELYYVSQEVARLMNAGENDLH